MGDKYLSPFVSYVFGIDNYKYLVDLGLECKLVDEKCLIRPQPMIHKIIGIQAALKDFDEVVCLDWDCAPTAMLPADFWDILGQKDVIQCPLYQCTRKVNHWREGRIPPKLLSGGFFVYMRDKQIPDILLDWDLNRQFRNKWADETFYSLYIDELMGGWQDEKTKNYRFDEYFRRFEPSMCGHVKASFEKENVCFYHPVKNKPII